MQIEAGREVDGAAAEFAQREWAAHDAEHFGGPFHREPFALTGWDGVRVVATATGWTGMGVGYLRDLIVDGALRGRGLGRQMMEAFEAHCLERGAHRLALRTEADGAARRFYEREGWVVEAVLREWLGDRDFVQMRKDLGRSA